VFALSGGPVRRRMAVAAFAHHWRLRIAVGCGKHPAIVVTSGRPWGDFMNRIARKASPAALILTLICFFLPFVTFSCDGTRMTFSGIQLVTGVTIQQPQMLGPPANQKIDPEPLAILAFLAAIGGLGLSFLKGKRSPVASAVLSAIGVIFLLALKSKIDGDTLRQGRGMVEVHYEAGFYLSLVLLLAAIGANAFALAAGRGIRLPAL
jgi:hypothetical protein